MPRPGSALHTTRRAAVRIGPAAVLLVAMAMVLLSCAGADVAVAERSGGGSETPAAVTGDGVLDCVDDEVAASEAANAFGSTEEAVVSAAFADWIDLGANVVALAPDESWMAVHDGRDVAIAYPELEGDGRWSVRNISLCGDADNAAALIDGKPDCISDQSWGVTGSSAVGGAVGDAAGDTTALAALRRFVDDNPLISDNGTRPGGRLVYSVEAEHATLSLVVEDREQLVVNVRRGSNGNWQVEAYQGCDGYQL